MTISLHYYCHCQSVSCTDWDLKGDSPHCIHLSFHRNCMRNGKTVNERPYVHAYGRREAKLWADADIIISAAAARLFLSLYSLFIRNKNGTHDEKLQNKNLFAQKLHYLFGYTFPREWLSNVMGAIIIIMIALASQGATTTICTDKYVKWPSDVWYGRCEWERLHIGDSGVGHLFWKKFSLFFSLSTFCTFNLLVLLEFIFPYVCILRSRYRLFALISLALEWPLISVSLLNHWAIEPFELSFLNYYISIRECPGFGFLGSG